MAHVLGHRKCSVNVLRLLRLFDAFRPKWNSLSWWLRWPKRLSSICEYRTFLPKQHLLVFFTSYYLRWWVFLGSHQISTLSCMWLLAEGYKSCVLHVWKLHGSMDPSHPTKSLYICGAASQCLRLRPDMSSSEDEWGVRLALTCCIMLSRHAGHRRCHKKTVVNPRRREGEFQSSREGQVFRPSKGP